MSTYLADFCLDQELKVYIWVTMLHPFAVLPAEELIPHWRSCSGGYISFRSTLP